MTDESASATLDGLVLPPGVTKEQVYQAISHSGYPLQTVVSHRLRAIEGISSQSEWGFLDRTTGEMRALDLLCIADLSDDNPNKYRVRPAVAALIECKRSDLPYVFFSEANTPFGHYPVVAGLPSETVDFKTDDDRSTWCYPILEALGLSRHEFIRAPKSCTTLSKCERKGKDLVLSGSDSYQSIVLPLRSALQHYQTSITPTHTPYYFDAQLVVAVVVLDAPMVAANVTDTGEFTVENVPWQRLWRNEPGSGAGIAREHGQTSAIDFVHIDFLEDYFKKHLLPFGREFAELAHSHAEELASGKAFAHGMGGDPFTDLATRMQPRAMPLPPPGEIIPKSVPRNLIILVKDLANITRSNLVLRARRRHH